MITWFLNLPLAWIIVISLILALVILLVIVHLDVYLSGWGQVKIPKEGLSWVERDTGKRRQIPPNPTGRDLTICFGHWLFKVFGFAMKSAFGWNDRVCGKPGWIPKNDETLFHEVYHASIESIEKGLVYLPWYVTHMAESEGNADAHARKMNNHAWGIEAVDYIHHQRRGRSA